MLCQAHDVDGGYEEAKWNSEFCMVGTLRPFAMKRRLTELQKLERLQLENKFIIDRSPLAHFGNNETPPRFNNTTTWRRSYSKDAPVIRGRILPQVEPYCRASFLVEITLPPEFPFKAPDLIFLDPIYHPNVDESGRQCCCGLYGGTDHWKPTSSIAGFVTHVINIINSQPIPDHGDSDRLHEYEFKYSKFYEKALRQTLSYGRPRY